MPSDRFTFSSAGQVHELEMAMDRAGGYNPALVKRMCEGDRLAHIREYLLGLAEIRYPDHVIDCDADPFVPVGLSVEEHRQGGFFKWNSAEVEFYLSQKQTGGGVIGGNELRRDLAGKPVFNANVLDYLMAHTHLIPEEWKKDKEGRTRYIFFWGTIYRDCAGCPFVRYLCWSDGRWCWSCCLLGGSWRLDNPAALRAS